jgi:hypothetical protein
MARTFDGSVLVRACIESNTSAGTESVDVQRQIRHPSYYSGSQAYGFMLFSRRITLQTRTYGRFWLSLSGAIHEVLMMIAFGVTLESFGSTDRF